MSDFFDLHHVVTAEEIDSQQHVNNLQYLRWTLGAANDHSVAWGWDPGKAAAEGLGWVVRSHEVTYKAAAVEGDRVVVRTWVTEVNRFAARRKYVVCRPSDRTILTRVETRWVYVDLNRHKVVPIPHEVRQHMRALTASPSLPWESPNVQ